LKQDPGKLARTGKTNREQAGSKEADQQAHKTIETAPSSSRTHGFGLYRPAESLIQSCPLRRKQSRIFDNIVERASREMMPNLV
jgi:hypothetical protein